MQLILQMGASTGNFCFNLIYYNLANCGLANILTPNFNFANERSSFVNEVYMPHSNPNKCLTANNC